MIKYRSMNSGGDWWLATEDWKALEAAGWKVAWRAEPWLGALATCATREGLSYEDAVEEWERITGLNSEATGCTCCGSPHAFYIDDDEDEDEDEGTP